jgi:hypothetical protein
MELNVLWHRPLTLTRSEDQIYALDLDSVPDDPGVYVFMRVFGKNHHPLYVGKAENLRTRLTQQLNAVKLMRGIEKAENGARRVAFAVFTPKKGQQTRRCLLLIERALIRHFLSEGHELLNKKGTRLANHTVISEVPPPKRKSFVPKIILFE